MRTRRRAAVYKHHSKQTDICQRTSRRRKEQQHDLVPITYLGPGTVRICLAHSKIGRARVTAKKKLMLPFRASHSTCIWIALLKEETSSLLCDPCCSPSTLVISPLSASLPQYVISVSATMWIYYSHFQTENRGSSRGILSSPTHTAWILTQ